MNKSAKERLFLRRRRMVDHSANTSGGLLVPTYASFKPEVRQWIEGLHGEINKAGFMPRSEIIRDLVEIAYNHRKEYGL